jgi:hypothetical protein
MAFDRYFGSVVLLMHGDGANNSTTYTDVAGHSISSYGYNNPVYLKTAQSKFGGSSIYTQAGHQQLRSTGTSSDFWMASGDYTVEFFFRLAAQPNAGDYWIFGLWNAANTGQATPALILSGGNNRTLYFRFYGAAHVTGPELALDTWYYIALVRSSGVARMYVDGTQVGSDYSNNVEYAQNPPYIFLGGAGSSDPNNCGSAITAYYDEIRITKGVARDVSAIPTEAFPDSGYPIHTPHLFTQGINAANQAAFINVAGL